MADPAALGTHFATLNLFKEQDGTFRLTCAGMSQEAFRYAEARGNTPPISALAAPITEAAEYFAKDNRSRGHD